MKRSTRRIGRGKSRVRVTRSRGEVVIECPTYHRKYFLPVIVGGALTVFLLRSALESTGNDLEDGIRVVCLSAAAFVFLYLGISGLVNRTCVMLDDRSLVVRERPLPRRWEQHVALDEIEEIRMGHRTLKNLARHSLFEDEIVAYLRQVYACGPGFRIPILRNHDNPLEAREIMRAIEDHIAEHRDQS